MTNSHVKMSRHDLIIKKPRIKSFLTCSHNKTNSFPEPVTRPADLYAIRVGLRQRCRDLVREVHVQKVREPFDRNAYSGVCEVSNILIWFSMGYIVGRQGSGVYVQGKRPRTGPLTDAHSKNFQRSGHLNFASGIHPKLCWDLWPIKMHPQRHDLFTRSPYSFHAFLITRNTLKLPYIWISPRNSTKGLACHILINASIWPRGTSDLWKCPTEVGQFRRPIVGPFKKIACKIQTVSRSW